MRDIKAIIAQHVARETTEHWLGILQPADVWCAKVLQWPELLESEGFQALDMLQTVERDDGVRIMTTRSPIRVNGERPPTSRAIRLSPPLLSSADSTYNRVTALLACFLFGLTLILVRRVAGTTGFLVQPRRWVVERSLGWLGRWRRLSKDYEERPEVSEAMVTLAMIRLMLHRLAHPNRKRLPAL